MHAFLCTRTDVHRQKTLKMTTIDRFSGLVADSKLKWIWWSRWFVCCSFVCENSLSSMMQVFLQVHMSAAHTDVLNCGYVQFRTNK